MIHNDLFHRRLDQAEDRVKAVRQGFTSNKDRWQHYGMVLYYLGQIRQQVSTKGGVGKVQVHVLLTDEPFTKSTNAIERHIAEAVLWMAMMGITVWRYWEMQTPNYWSHFVEVEV